MFPTIAVEGHLHKSTLHVMLHVANEHRRVQVAKGLCNGEFAHQHHGGTLAADKLQLGHAAIPSCVALSSKWKGEWRKLKKRRISKEMPEEHVLQRSSSFQHAFELAREREKRQSVCWWLKAHRRKERGKLGLRWLLRSSNACLKYMRGRYVKIDHLPPTHIRRCWYRIQGCEQEAVPSLAVSLKICFELMFVWYTCELTSCRSMITKQTPPKRPYSGSKYCPNVLLFRKDELTVNQVNYVKWWK